MLSEFRRRKLTRFFAVVDADGDGVFTAADTELVAERLARLRGLDPASSEHASFRAGFMYYWQDVRRACDSDVNGRVTLSEWIAYHEVMLADAARFEATAQNSAGLMFALVDADEDGVISPEEYGTWMRAWGMTDDESSAEVLRRINPGGGGLTREAVLERTREFFYSEDPDAPGNWAMGPL